MSGDEVRATGLTAGTAPVDLVIAVSKPASPQIGTAVRARRGLRSEIAIVLGVRGGDAEVVWPNGEIASLPWGRLKEVLATPTDVMSIPGRLLRLLSSKSAEPYVTEQSRDAVQNRIEELTQLREHAVGLLLDRRRLSLSIDDCLALPLEPWRVRYEFLASARNEFGLSSDFAVQLAREIVADDAAPLGVRTRVAIAYSLPLSEVGPEAEVLFAYGEVGVPFPVLKKAALDLSDALRAAGAVTAGRLKLAAGDPEQLAAATTAGALLNALERHAPAGKRIKIDSTTPPSVIDDLIDRGIPLDTTATDSTNATFGDRAIPTPAYVTARTDPGTLTSEEVVALRFEAEAVRRYLAGDMSVGAALPASSAADLQELRAVITGAGTTNAATDPLVQELTAVLAAAGRIAPSEALLADESVWQVLIDAGVPGDSSGGLLGERFAGLSALKRASTALYEWRWDDARAIARDGLRLAKREEVRDELLNVMACGLWLQGETEPALAALDSALEGAYTDELLVNASVVAVELDHFTARDRLVRIAKEAPSAHQRAMAAERALILWINDDDRVWEEDDETLPAEIRDALRPLIRESLPEDRYLRILKVLASHDDDWLASQPDSAFGANSNSASIRIFKARAAGLDEFAGALAAELKPGIHAEWVVRERDSVVDAAIEVLLERNDELSAALFGLTLIDADLPMSAEQRVPLKCLTVASIVANIDPEESEPKDRFIDFIVESHGELAMLDADDQERLGKIVTIAAERLAAAYFGFRYNEFDEVIDAYNAMMDKIRSIPSRNLNRQAVREAFAPIRRFCTETWNILNRLLPFLEDKELRKAIISMMNQASAIGHGIVEVTR
jgi:hypothetical protein